MFCLLSHKMGNTIGNAIADKQKAMQKGMLEEMQKNQMRGADKQRKIMLSMQQAFVRERCVFFLFLFFYFSCI